MQTTNSKLIANRVRTSGFTLSEAMIASVVLAVSVVGVASALTASAKQSTGSSDNSECLAMSQALMEEIIARPFDPPESGDASGWYSGARKRGRYDNIADFNGYEDTIGSPRFQDDSFEDEQAPDPKGEDDGKLTEVVKGVEAEIAAELDGDQGISGNNRPAGNSEGFNRTVSVEFRDSLTGPAVASGHFAIITVKVTGLPDGGEAYLTRVVTRVNYIR